MQLFIKIHPDDNVAVALKALSAGSTLSVGDKDIIVQQDIPSGHKFALCDIGEGEDVIKYGASIGKATAPVCKGGWVHIHNMRTGLGESTAYTWEQTPIPEFSTNERHHFLGYRRNDGKVGIRNEIWIIPTVGCVNDVAAAIERQAQEFLCGSLDAIVAFRHPYGCSQMGEDQENTRKILADLIRHPNAGGVLVLGLGCENSGADVLKKYIGTVLEFFFVHRDDSAGAIAHAVLSNTDFWGEDLNENKDFCAAVTKDLQLIEKKGAYELMRQCISAV